MFEFLVSNPFVQAIQENPIWQWLWIFAMSISIMWYMQKDDKKTIKIFIWSNLVRMAHFYFLWTFSAMASCLVAIARSFLSLKYKRNKKIFLSKQFKNRYIRNLHKWKNFTPSILFME